MDLRKTLLTASEILKKNNIDHALIGGFALAFHGINRATADVDFLADGKRREDILRILIEEGFRLRHSTTEVLQFEGPGFLDILLANRPLSQAMLRNARLEKSLSIQVLKVEDLIGLKIQAYVNDPSRELQDKADIQSLISGHPALDWGLVQNYADLFEQWNEIQNIRKKI